MGPYEWLRSKGFSKKLVFAISFGGLVIVEAITLFIYFSGRAS